MLQRPQETVMDPQVNPALRASAIFLDRDGVINDVVERDGVIASPRSAEELRITTGAPSVLGALRAAGYRLFVVTNQPDIARGLMSRQALAEIHDQIRRQLPVEAIGACIHDSGDACGCRKPKPGLIFELAREHGIDLAASWMIGDQDRDVACGRNAGVATILLRRPYNSGKGADHTASGLTEAATLILTRKIQP